MSKNVNWDAEGNWKAKGDWGTQASGGKRFVSMAWQVRLDELRKQHNVPGATLAVLVDGEIHELASGVLHRGTGVAATTDSVFLCGSVAKVYTATLIMQLADQGKLDLDAPVVSVLPEFATPDEAATAIITPRQLLSHTGGVTNDFNYDGGRGDNCLAEYVRAAREVALDCKPGTAVSYGSLGYVVLGRIIEVLTGKTWDQALHDMIAAPAGLDHLVTLPEEALRFRVAMSHLGEPGEEPEPAPVWDMMPRAFAPAGRVITTAGDMVRFAQLHLNEGRAADGTTVLSAERVAEMQRRVVDTPDKWSVSSDGWGLGWTLYDWEGVQGYGHDGAAIGQYAYLRIVPGANVAVALLTNGGGARQLYAALFRELLAELADVQMPGAFEPANPPIEVDIEPYVGSYKRAGVVITVSKKEDGSAHMLYEFVDDMEGVSPPLSMDLTPVTPTVFAASGAGPSFSEDYMPVVFATLTDGTEACYVGMRATPKQVAAAVN